MYLFHQQSLYEARALVTSGTSFPVVPFAGIAAFPSLHVGNLIVVFVIALRYCKIAAPFVGYYLAGTVLAATCFGWHYIVDYLGGAVIALGVTYAVEALVPRRPNGSSASSP